MQTITTGEDCMKQGVTEGPMFFFLIFQPDIVEDICKSLLEQDSYMFIKVMQQNFSLCITFKFKIYWVDVQYLQEERCLHNFKLQKPNSWKIGFAITMIFIVELNTILKNYEKIFFPIFNSLPIQNFWYFIDTQNFNSLHPSDVQIQHYERNTIFEYIL